MTRLGKHSNRDPDYAEMMSFLDEIDKKFNLEELDEMNLLEIKEFWVSAVDKFLTIPQSQMMVSSPEKCLSCSASGSIILIRRTPLRTTIITAT